MKIKKILAAIILIAAIIALLFSVFWWVCDKDWLEFIDAIKSLAEASAVVIGGIWTWYLFWLQREKEPAIGIEFKYKCIPNGSQLSVVYFDVTFSNIGKVRVQGRRSRNPAYPTAKDRPDKEETLQYGCSLLLRHVPHGLPANAVLDWFNQESGERGKELGKLVFDTPPIEADLLYDYAIKLSSGEVTDFWMEPGELYDVGVGFVLLPGTYLAIITFLGETSDDELWRRKALIEIPKLESLGPVT